MFWKLYEIRINEDEELNVNEGKRSTIRVGSGYQAEVPKTAFEDDEDTYTPDTLLWKPSVLSEDQTKKYLQSVGAQDTTDEEKALWLLHQCNYNTEEALRRHQLVSHTMQFDSTWTEYERQCFEKGIQKYGKNFHAIQKLLRSKSVEEVVDFYYEWKVEKMRHAALNGQTLTHR